MYRSTRMPAGQERRGVILLVVITLLTLFAVVGLTFVYYAEAEATASRIFREAQDGNPDGGKFTGLPTETVFSWSLGQIIYPVPDNAMGVYTSIRGHDLSRKIYGWNSDTTVRGLNQTPFNGVGRMYAAVTHPSPDVNGLDSHFLPNYMFFRDLDPNFLRDPERPGSRPDLATPPRQWVGGDHAPYTYPDVNNIYLAAVRPDNTVMVPSYHRPWLFGALDDPANPNWTNVRGKYLTLRPRRADNDPSFPMPGDAGGDVKNLVGGPGGNDSIWIDLGYPVQSFTDGAGRVHYYKPLFAILVRDLDSLINVNVHGNILGANNTHASHQGWGKWEINPSKILNDTTVADEWNRIFRGNGSIAGRYGNNNAPSSGPGGTVPPAAPVTPSTPGYSQHNYNAITESAPAGPGLEFHLPGFPPGPGGHSPTTSFPRYNGGTPADRGYANSSAFEVTNHPSLFDFFRPNPLFPPAGWDGHDRVFDVSEIRKLNCYAPSGFSDLNTSELARLCPNNLNPATTNPALLRSALMRRHLITTHSFDLDSPGASPMVWDPNVANAAQRYELAAASLFPVGDALAFPTTFGPPPADSEFGTDWRSLSAMLPRVDLNRPLRNYPTLTGGGTLDLATDPMAYPNAQQDRHTLARDIFIRLCWATGTPCTYNPDGTARNPAPTYASAQVGDAARWLAQLAVNIVDFIDNDDFLTPFNWNPTIVQAGNTPPEIDAFERSAVVYGNELNRAVLNEVYVEYKNDPMDPLTGGMATTDYHVRVWAELHNPLPDNQVLYDGGQAQFSVAGAVPYNPYQLLLTKPNTALRAPNNVRGEPDPAPGQVWTTLNAWTGHPPLSPSGGATANPATQPPTYFSLVGPKSLVNGVDEPFPGTDPAPPVPHMYATEMAYKSPLRDGMGNVVEPDPPTLLLRRLACPYLPPQPDPSQAMYNPYITVDYADMKVNDPDPVLQRGQINRAITHTAAGAVMGGMEATMPQNRAAWGRRQPYAAHISMRARQNTTYAGQPQQTFGSATGTVAAVNNPTANGPGSPSFDWLVFRDRPLISGSELLDVSAVKPHELSQQFIVDLNNNATLDAGEKFLHRADWRNPRARIYRALEWLTTHDRAAGMNFGGRIAGRINVNTIYEQEVFRAWADSQSNRFTPAEVDAAWNLLVAQRTPRLTQANNQITPNDRPFRGLAAPFVTPVTAAGQPTPYPNTPEFTFTPAGTSQADTMLSDSFKLNGMPHPNLENELLTKILGNATTRSNTFAVWITVGYFEVTDINSRPVKLGAEFRPQGGAVVRQRGFAVVDRTGLSLFNDGTTSTVPDEMTKCAQVTATGLQTVPIQALQGPAGTTWQIQPGTLLRLRDSYFGGEEVVTVLSVDNTAAPPTFTAYFGRTHTVPPGPPAPPALPISVAILGNPGPQPTFSYTNTYKYGHVVPHFMLLN